MGDTGPPPNGSCRQPLDLTAPGAGHTRAQACSLFSPNHRQGRCDMPIRIACIGAGPGGLFLGTIVKRLIPDATIEIFERNRADDTFGFGVVFSDRTLAGIHAADPVLRDALTEHGRHWDEIEVRLKGQRFASAATGWPPSSAAPCWACCRTAPPRSARTCASRPTVTRHSTTGRGLRPGRRRGRRQLGQPASSSPTSLAPGCGDRDRQVHLVRHRLHVRRADLRPRKSEHGIFAVHGYPISDELSTFIVETDEAAWRQAGLDEFDVSQPPGPSDMMTKDYLEKLFADQIDGDRCWPTTPDGATSAPGAPALAHRATSRSSATPCTPHTSRSARARRWRWRTPSPWPPRWPRTRQTSRHAGRPTRRSASPQVREDPGLGAAQPVAGGSTSAATTTPSSPGSSPTTSCPAASPSAKMRQRDPQLRGREPNPDWWRSTAPTRSGLRSAVAARPSRPPGPCRRDERSFYRPRRHRIASLPDRRSSRPGPGDRCWRPRKRRPGRRHGLSSPDSAAASAHRGARRQRPDPESLLSETAAFRQVGTDCSSPIDAVDARPALTPVLSGRADAGAYSTRCQPMNDGLAPLFRPTRDRRGRGVQRRQETRRRHGPVARRLPGPDRRW